MKKSSLGRRSSVLNQGWPSGNTERKSVRTNNEGKKSLIPKACFSNKNGRSSSIERDLNATIEKKHPQTGLRRSRSFSDFSRTSTPCYTPMQYSKSSSVYRNQSEGGRMSSFGGLKSARKESRPITEKFFQVASQTKIQQFFQSRSPELLDKGSIKPMTMSMFADLVNYILSKFDKRLIISKTNNTEEVMNICKLYNYKGKADRSWLMTVNAPHSWPHVVSFLVWLVDLFLIYEAFNPDEDLYLGEEGDPDINDLDFKLLVPHLLKGYNIVYKQKGDQTEEINKFLVKHKLAMNVDEKIIESLKREYTQLQEELNNAEDSGEEHILHDLKTTIESLRNDSKNTQTFIYDSQNYIATMNEKHKDNLRQLEKFDSTIQDLKKDKEQLKLRISNQEMSQEHENEIKENIAVLNREIRSLNEEMIEYQNEIYKEDIELVGVKTAFNKLIQAYNKKIVVNLVLLPELKNVQIEDNYTLHMDAPDAEQRFKVIDDNLHELKNQQKLKKNDIERAILDVTTSLQKIEDELGLRQEEFEKLQNECINLENNIAQLKNSINKEKEQMKNCLMEIHDKIKIEKERLEEENSFDETELLMLEKEYNSQKQKFDEDIVKMKISKQNKVERYENRVKAYQEVTNRELEKRKTVLENIKRNVMSH